MGGGVWWRVVCGWRNSVPYEALANCFFAIGSTTKRLEKEDILCNFLRCVIATSPQDLLVCVNMAANRLAPAFDGVEIGIGDSIMIKAIVEVRLLLACVSLGTGSPLVGCFIPTAQCTGRKKRDVKAQVHKLGDLGLVAEASKAKQAVLFTPARLTVKKVFDTLFALANMTGNKSQNKKVGIACVLGRTRGVLPVLPPLPSCGCVALW